MANRRHVSTQKKTGMWANAITSAHDASRGDAVGVAERIVEGEKSIKIKNQLRRYNASRVCWISFVTVIIRSRARGMPQL